MTIDEKIDLLKKENVIAERALKEKVANFNIVIPSKLIATDLFSSRAKSFLPQIISSVVSPNYFKKYSPFITLVKKAFKLLN